MSIKDLSVLFGVIMIIIMLVIPLPGPLLSVLILINISLALVVILVAMNVKEALEFSVFPSLLLLLTLFRLGLNVSTTRSILSEANAGGVVDTFGNFVTGGNPLVGFVVFLILVVIQFIVITKGAERVSEVAARFTLDAMPGKQMSIDADLNAGLITEQQAKDRREKIEDEADFYGAMDGASKFVKGDAIAGIVIVLINIIFGFIIGMTQFGLSAGETVDVFLRLTVGDGLVSQIPALLIATGTGIIVTRVAAKGNLSYDVTSQLFRFPKLLYIAAGTIFLLGLTPINFALTTVISGMLGFGGFYLSRAEERAAEPIEEVDETEERAQEMAAPENVVQLLNTDPIEFEFGYALIPIADQNQGGDLLDRVVMIRRQLALELGLVIPVVRIRDNIQLNPNEYQLKIKGNQVAQGELYINHYLAMSPDLEDDGIDGIETKEPAFGLPAKWITEEMKEEAELLGYTVVDPPSVVSTHITEVIKRYAHELIGREETRQLIDHLKETHPILVEEITPEPLSVGEIQKVLAKLLSEQISIRNLPIIFETLADYSKMTNDTDLLTEYCRQALSVQITNQYAQNQFLKVVTLSPQVEKMVVEGIQQTAHGNFITMDPENQQKLIEAVHQELTQAYFQDSAPIVLCSPAVRMYVKQIIGRALPETVVLSYNELEPTVEVESSGVVNVQ